MAIRKTDPEGDHPGPWVFVCDQCKFVSAGHLTRSSALARQDEHYEEHETGVPMRSIHEFDAEHRKA